MKKSQLQKGIKIEHEHEPTYNWLKAAVKRGRFPTLEEFAESIAKDHLNEFDDYYLYLEAMEDLAERGI